MKSALSGDGFEADQRHCMATVTLESIVDGLVVTDA